MLLIVLTLFIASLSFIVLIKLKNKKQINKNKLVVKDNNVKHDLLIINIDREKNRKEILRRIIIISGVILSFLFRTPEYSLLLFLFSIIIYTILCNKMEIEYNSYKIVNIKHPKNNLVTKLDVRYIDNSLAIIENQQSGNMHIKYNFIEISIGYGKNRITKHKLKDFKILIYKNNKCIYNKSEKAFNIMYNKQHLSRRTDYVNMCIFIKTAMNDAIKNIIISKK